MGGTLGSLSVFMVLLDCVALGKSLDLSVPNDGDVQDPEKAGMALSVHWTLQNQRRRC